MNSAHQTPLQAKHALLERQLQSELQRPLPDALIIADLKKQKLRVKQELSAH